MFKALASLANWAVPGLSWARMAAAAALIAAIGGGYLYWQSMRWELKALRAQIAVSEAAIGAARRSRLAAEHAKAQGEKAAAQRMIDASKTAAELRFLRKHDREMLTGKGASDAAKKWGNGAVPGDVWRGLRWQADDPVGTANHQAAGVSDDQAADPGSAAGRKSD